MPSSLYIGFKGSTIWVVEQFGLAIIISSSPMASPLISGTTNFLFGSMRQKEELSITRQPAAANSGASFEEMPPPADRRANAGLAAMASSADTTVHSRPRNSTFRPIDFSDATGNNSLTGKSFSSNNFNIIVPTSPVAPTTATFIYFQLKISFIILPAAMRAPSPAP